MTEAPEVAGATVLVVGGGGREHAIVWALAKSMSVAEVIVAPGNPGTAAEPGCRNVAIQATDISALIALAVAESVDLVVVGPEDPLVLGLVDRLAEQKIAAFGPSAAAAQLEGSKSHCKEFLLRNHIPTGRSRSFTDSARALAYLAELVVPPVVKADGLAAGKGVIVAETHQEADVAIREILDEGRFGDAGAEVLLEERLHGPEVSVLAFCDGERFHIMPAAQDHKRLCIGDDGPNTGGMGAFFPSPVADDQLLADVATTVFAPTLAALASEGRPYRGVLYAGIMLTTEGPKVIEYNCRFGDPETEVVLPLLESDLYEILMACATGSLDDADIQWSSDAAVTVVMASRGYPLSRSEPAPIIGIDAAVASGCMVFHAGTATGDGEVVTAGGRVLTVTALRPTLDEAADVAHEGVALISFDGAQHRADIARETAEARL
jgi:phosphoribosylamine--glycine ligase